MLESSGRMQNEPAKHGASAGYFAGGGEMHDRIRAFDWSKSPLGPIEEWPISLRTIVAVMLGNRYPMAVWWGAIACSFIMMLFGRYSAISTPLR